MFEKLAAMPKYELYKDSGVEWLGEIPAHWDLTPWAHALKSEDKKFPIKIFIHYLLRKMEYCHN